MRFALLGPAPPLHGGIVTYLAMLHRTLAARGHAVHWAGFRRQYPGFLFPGRSQTGDTAAWMPQPDTRLFVPWSPWSWRRTADALAAARPDAVVLKYWIPYFAPGFAAVLRRLRRRTDARLLYVLDNVVAHERYPLAGPLTRAALRPAHGFVAQSEQVRRDLAAVVPDIPPDRVRLCPHPVYDFGVPGRPRKDRAAARRAVGVPDDVRLVLFFGYVKPYKGVRYLVEAAPRLRERYGDGVKVLIVGDVYGDRAEYTGLIERLGVGDVVELRDGYVPDDAVEDHFLAADVVALPYVSATQSGIVQIAYNYDLPVVSTRVGGLPEVVLDGETGLLVPPQDPAALAAALIRYFDEGLRERFAPAVAQEKGKYTWDRLAATLEELAAAGETA